ncbi:MAG: riboflavin synthase [Pseudomonadota bacterium]
MFTGIVREVGRVLAISRPNDTKIRISCSWEPETIEIGASVSCNGACLTVTATGTEGSTHWFEIDASDETLSKTTLGDWITGSAINLEPALKLGDELGGHIVSGHVDCVGDITAIRPEAGSHRISIAMPRELGKFVASKGSVTVDGISLTVNEVEDTSDTTTFGVNIIPHTWTVTSLAQAAEGSRVNLEIDLLARYVARLAEASPTR